MPDDITSVTDQAAIAAFSAYIPDVEADLTDRFSDQLATFENRERKRRIESGDYAGIEYEIVAEGEGVVEILAYGRNVTLKREIKTGPGRPRKNPYIDVQEISRLPANVRDACYAAAHYMLRKDGIHLKTSPTAGLCTAVEQRLFNGTKGKNFKDHLTLVARFATAAVDSDYGSADIEATVGVIAEMVAREITKKLKSEARS